MSTPTTTPTPAAGSDPGPTPEQIDNAAQAEARLAALLGMADVNQANAATGVYGDSGTGKSTLAATSAEYAWTRYHRKSRYYIADPGGFGNKLIRLIRLGIVEVYNPTNHIEPFATMEDISKGYWPAEILDPYTGYAAPDVPLLPPQRTRYVVYCPQGHVVATLQSKKPLGGFSQQCPTCKGAPVTPQNWSKVEEQIVRSKGTRDVGLYIFDSGTALGDWAMDDMAARAAASDPTIKDGNALSGTGARILSGSYAFGANTQQHYGFAQIRMRTWIKNSRLIPGIVMPSFWTFLLARGENENANSSVFGPKIPGQAQTSAVPSWLGNCLHTETYTNDKGVRKHRLWLVNHDAPGTRVPFLAKTRSEPGDLPPYLEDPDGEPLFSRFSMGYFFDQLEQALNKHAEQDVKDFPNAPIFQTPEDGAEEDEVVGSKDLNAQGLGTPVVGRARVNAPAVARAAVAGGARPASVAPAAAAGPKATVVAAPAAAAAPKAAASPAAAVAKPAVAAPAAQAATAARPAATAAPAVPAAAARPAAQAQPAQAPPAPAQPPRPAAVSAPAGVRPPTPSAVPRRVTAPPPAGKKPA